VGSVILTHLQGAYNFVGNLQDSHRWSSLSNFCSGGMRVLVRHAHSLHDTLWHWRAEEGLCFSFQKLPSYLNRTLNLARSSDQT